MNLNYCTTDKICKHLTLIYDNFKIKGQKINCYRMDRLQSISSENLSSVTPLQNVLFLLLWTSFCFRRYGIFLSTCILGLCLSRSIHQYVKGLSTENSQMLFRILNKVSINSCTYYVGETVVNCQSDE